MTEYKYCKKDLLKHPEKYQMTPYEGVKFLQAYSDLRHQVIEKLNVNYNTNFERFVTENFHTNEIPEDFIDTNKFLKLVLTEKIIQNLNKNNEEILDIFLKKFEVKKKLFTRYDKQYKEITDDYFDLRNYILLSANFVVAYQQTMNLKYLNTSLKLNDLVISNIEKVLDKCYRELFFMILQLEVDCINNLWLKKR